MAGEPQAVGGISVPLTLDPSGWTAGLRRARADLEQLRREAAQLSSPAAQARRSPVTAGGVGVPAGVTPLAGAPAGNLAAVGGVSPRFNVSQGAVRDMRIEINRQLRTFASQGEAVAIPVKLGRVPYAAFRQELSAGIGEVPVKITLDPGAIASLRGQVMRAVGLTAPGSGGPVGGIPRRAAGGPAQPGQPLIVGEHRAEVFEPTVPGRIRPQVTMQDQMRQRQLDVIRRQLMVDRGSYPQRAAGGLVGGRYARSAATSNLSPEQANFSGNVMTAGARLQPHNIQGGINWYREMAAYGQERSKHYGVSPRVGVGVLAALSAGTEWKANKTKFERIMAAHAAGKPFPYETKLNRSQMTLLGPDLERVKAGLDAHRKAKAILGGMAPEHAFATSPKVGQFYRGGMGDLDALVIDLWATRTATQGGMSQPGRARPGIEAAFRQGAKAVGLRPAEFQAALWLQEKEESKVPPGQMGMGFARGGRVGRPLGRMRDRMAMRWQYDARNRAMGYSLDSPRMQEMLKEQQRGERGPMSGRAYDAYMGGYSNVVAESLPGQIADPGEVHLTGQSMSKQDLLTNLRDPSIYSIVEPGRFPRNARGGRIAASSGQMGMGFAPKFPRSRPFCTLCGVTMVNEYDHRATAGHKKKMGARVGQGGIKLNDRPFWMLHPNTRAELEDAHYEEQALLEEERSSSYPGGKWIPGMYRGGPTLKSTFPNASIDLGRLDRRRRLAVGKRALDLGQRFPKTAREIEGIEAVWPFHMSGISGASDDIGFTERGSRWTRSRIGLNAGISDEQIKEAMKHGWGVGGDMADVLTHEFGHAFSLAHASPATAAPLSQAATTRRLMRKLGSPSEYAEQDPDEKFAELFTLHHLTGLLPQIVGNKRARGGQARMRGAGFVPGLRSIAQGYNRMVGLPRMQEQMLHPLNPDFSRRTAAAYEQMPVGPDDLSRQAYKAFGEETAAQYEYLQKAGFRFEPDPGDPYSPKPGDKLTKMQMAAQDVRRNKRLLAFSSSLEHPLLTNEQNLQFRHVHDMMGHLAEGYSIGPRGEFNAAVKHSQMFTPLARRAMLAETHGQNSVVNFSSTVMPGFGGRSIAEVNKAAPGTIYAQQKAQVLPDDILEEFYGLTGIKRAAGGRARFAFNPANTRDLYPTMRETRKEIGRGDWEFGLHGAPPDLAEIRRSMGLDNWYNPDKPRFGTDRIEVPPKLNPKVGRGYLFHGTGAENLSSIARRGVIPRTGGANLYGTPWEHEFANDPVSWWETRLRSSFGGGAAGWGEHVLRARQRGLKTDWGPSGMSEEKLLRQTVPPEALEILSEDASWRPITSLFKRAGGGPVNKIDILKRLSRTMQPFSGSQFEPFQKPIMLPGQGGGKWVQIDPRWLPREQIDPAFLEKNAAGGPVTRSWRFADPNGLHMRPAAGFARALELASVNVTGRNLSNGQELQNPKSLYSWMTLGARQGHQIELTFDGPDSARISKLFGQMMGFNPEKTGMGYHEFQKQLGIGNPATEALEMRMAQASRWDRFKKAGGGDANKGRYIVNELGIEKFVPDRLAHQIPPDVASQIPGGGSLMERLSRARGEDQPEPFRPAWMRRNNAKDLTGRAGGGIVEIPGRGPRVWEAPEDGWIIPARLAGKIPARQAGGPTFGGGGFEQGMAEEEMRRRRAEQLRRDQEMERVIELRQQALRIGQQARSARENLYGDLPQTLTGSSQFNDLSQAARLSQTLNRGLTGRAGLGGAFAGLFGGGQARRESMLQGQAFARQYEKMAPPGQDAILFYGEKLQDLEDIYGEQNKILGRLEKSTIDVSDAMDALNKDMGVTKRDIGTTREALQTAGQLRQQAEESFAKAQGGTARNILSLTAAGFAYSTAAQALQVGLELASKAAAPFIDQLTGFSSTSIRVTKELAGQARDLGGNVPSAVAGAAGPAGIGGAGLDFLTRALSGPISAKAGAAAADEATNLLRAAAGAGNAPTGLFGGFGGVGGGPALGEFLGGGKGFTEVLAGAVGGFRQQQETGIERAGLERKAIFGSADEARQAEQSARAGFEALNVTVKDYNESAERGAKALDEHSTGLRLATRETLGLTEATDDAIQTRQQELGRLAGDEENAKNLAKSGVFLVDAAGNLATGTEEYRKFFQQSAQGRTVQSEAAFAVQQTRGLQAQRQLGREQSRFATDIAIPGEAGQQLLAQPFIPAGAGVPRGPAAPLSSTAMRDLREANRLQDELMAGARQAVEEQARFVDQNVGTGQGNQFRGYVSQIAEVGTEIAGITESISNRQAQASYAAYANNIRLINRSLSDARGLLSGRGGANNLGVIQRQQFELSRQSQKLSLESQRLQLQSNELQLQLSQRQINFQRAIAGFQAPGITGQERAARMAEAELEASFAQRQLDIGRQQQGIGREQLGISGEQLGLELRAFMEGARRAVVDLEAQRALVTQQYQLEQEQIAAQRRINALSVRQGQLQAKASALFAEASGNFNAQLAAGAQYVAQFGGTLAAAITALRKALTSRPGTYGATGGGAYYPGNQTPHAAGYSATVDRPTSFIAGEAGSEHVMVIRNPTSGVMGPAGGGGGWMGGQGHITINVSGNQFGANLDETEVARKLADEVERRFETKARLLNVNA